MYEIILYDTEDERCPVQELLDSLEPKLLAKTLRTIDLLEMNGPLLREPYSKPLENGIFELRAKQGSDITRVLYFFIIGKKAVLTNGFPLIFASPPGNVQPANSERLLSSSMRWRTRRMLALLLESR